MAAGQPGAPGEIIANFEAAGMEGPRPVLGFGAGKIVPLNTEAVLAITTMKALPAATQSFPDKCFVKIANRSAQFIGGNSTPRQDMARMGGSHSAKAGLARGGEGETMARVPESGSGCRVAGACTILIIAIMTAFPEAATPPPGRKRPQAASSHSHGAQNSLPHAANSVSSRSQIRVATSGLVGTVSRFSSAAAHCQKSLMLPRESIVMRPA